MPGLDFHSTEVIPANVRDITVVHKLIRPEGDFASEDNGYIGLEKRSEIVNDPVLTSKEYMIVKRP